MPTLHVTVLSAHHRVRSIEGGMDVFGVPQEHALQQRRVLVLPNPAIHECPEQRRQRGPQCDLSCRDPPAFGHRDAHCMC